VPYRFQYLWLRCTDWRVIGGLAGALTARMTNIVVQAPPNLVITRGRFGRASVRERGADSLVRHPHQHGARVQPSGALTLSTNIIMRSLELVEKIDVEFWRRLAEAITKPRCLSESLLPTARSLIQYLNSIPDRF
jgi:hypothetical protein